MWILHYGDKQKLLKHMLDSSGKQALQEEIGGREQASVRVRRSCTPSLSVFTARTEEVNTDHWPSISSDHDYLWETEAQDAGCFAQSHTASEGWKPKRWKEPSWDAAGQTFGGRPGAPLLLLVEAAHWWMRTGRRRRKREKQRRWEAGGAAASLRIPGAKRQSKLSITIQYWVFSMHFLVRSRKTGQVTVPTRKVFIF